MEKKIVKSRALGNTHILEIYFITLPRMFLHLLLSTPLSKLKLQLKNYLLLSHVYNPCPQLQMQNSNPSPFWKQPSPSWQLAEGSLARPAFWLLCIWKFNYYQWEAYLQGEGRIHNGDRCTR